MLQDKGTIPEVRHCHPRVRTETQSPSGTKMELNENGNSSVTKPSPW